LRRTISFKYFLIILSIFLFYGIFTIFSSYVYYAGTAETFHWDQRFILRLPSYLLWAFLIPVIYPLILKYKIEEPNRLNNIFKIILIGIAAALIHRVLTTAIVQVLAGIFFNENIDLYTALITQKYFVLALAFDSFIMFAIIAAVIYAVDYYRQSNENRIKASRFQTELAKTELNSLKMQIHPHFLFNTLNSISVLIKKDPDAAEKMLVQLSGLLRSSLDNSGSQFVDFSVELNFLTKYLDIQKVRFKERLIFEKDISEEALSFKIPYLIIQPLIENSIKHVLEKQKEPCVIKLQAEVKNEKLEINISDNGRGIASEEEAFSSGFGLSSVKSRLDHFYGSDHTFKFFNKNGLNFLIILPQKNNYD
jgi:two-component system, LytTR family, sensor kinase